MFCARGTWEYTNRSSLEICSTPSHRCTRVIRKVINLQSPFIDLSISAVQCEAKDGSPPSTASTSTVPRRLQPARTVYSDQMALSDWPGHSALVEDGKKRELAPPDIAVVDRADNRPSGTYVAIPISTEPRASRSKRSWLRRYWIFVLAMAILIVGGIIAGAVGGITASHQAEQRGSA
ncbi:hypothetical protein HER10_EVM0009948 [Colletotrichum scovillei]|uniref:uncharacterized protein n=1 Tax=Colletotrichum scovillei TaxID=1209932 RepID=UPI0015C2FDFE|nr:uncharacterized protein HER10_EVM0009948 [Colletotrichum scovillei]KAF4776918.1 hypothetical protein HER10_EVM0009948 [Colletotrichum scovillei]